MNEDKPLKAVNLDKLLWTQDVVKKRRRPTDMNHSLYLAGKLPLHRFEEYIEHMEKYPEDVETRVAPSDGAD